MIYAAIILFFFFVGACIAYDRHRHTILKPHDPNIPFTSQELSDMGIHLPDSERYDCETFVR